MHFLQNNVHYISLVINITLHHLISYNITVSMIIRVYVL